MLAEMDFKRLFHKLIRQFSAQVHLAGSEITMEFLDHASKLQLSAPVYLGSNYIPKSVRSCLLETPPFFNCSMRTTFAVDEEHFRILLNFQTHLDRSDEERFEEIVEHFGALVEAWKVLLDERDKNDLVYISVR